MADLDSQYSHLNLCEITLCEEIVGRTKNGNKGSSFRSTEALNIETEYPEIELGCFCKIGKLKQSFEPKSRFGKLLLAIN